MFTSEACGVLKCTLDVPDKGFTSLQAHVVQLGKKLQWRLPQAMMLQNAQSLG
jgi:hypothetical protein